MNSYKQEMLIFPQVAGCLRSAVDLTGTLLLAMGFGEEESEEARVHSPEILQVMLNSSCYV